MKFENTSAKPSFIDGDSCPVDANQRFLFLRYITHKHLEEKFVVCRFICYKPDYIFIHLSAAIPGG